MKKFCGGGKIRREPWVSHIRSPQTPNVCFICSFVSHPSLPAFGFVLMIQYGKCPSSLRRLQRPLQLINIGCGPSYHSSRIPHCSWFKFILRNFYLRNNCEDKRIKNSPAVCQFVNCFVTVVVPVTRCRLQHTNIITSWASVMSRTQSSPSFLPPASQ